MTAPDNAREIRVTPVARFLERAAAIVNSDPVVRIYAACEWDDLHEDGKEWVAAIVRETLARTPEGADQATDVAGIDRPMRPIPIGAARRIADAYGYDQVVVIGRRVGTEPDPYGEHVTTYGVDPTHCEVAARAGEALRRFMSWPLDPADKLRARIAELEAQLAATGQRLQKAWNASGTLPPIIFTDEELKALSAAIGGGATDAS